METTTQTYTVQAFKLPRIEAALAILNKRCRRLSIPEITLKVTGSNFEEREIRGEMRQVLFNTVEVTGARPRLDGWEFAATFEHDAETGLTILRSNDAFKVAIPVEYRKASAVCDHCKLARRRNDTFLCYSASEGFKQIGRNCLRDFLGHKDPHAVLAAAEAWIDLSELFGADDLTEDQGWEAGGGGSREIILPLLEFVERAFAVTREFGFVSRGKVKEDQTGKLQSTANRTLTLIFPSAHDRLQDWWKKEEQQTTPTAFDAERSQAALEWIRGFVGDETASDYVHNVAVACAGDFMPIRRAGIVASLPAAFLKHLDRQAELIKQRETRPESLFVGTIGERLRNVKLTVEKIIAKEGDFGVTYITKMRDTAGNAFTWFASGTQLEEGKAYLVTGTVKDHAKSERFGNATILSRCDCQDYFHGYDDAEPFGGLYVRGETVFRPFSNEKLTFDKASKARAFAKKWAKSYSRLNLILADNPTAATLGKIEEKD